MRITSEGQVTIPRKISKQRGLTPDGRAVVELTGGDHEPIRFVLPPRSESDRGRMVIERALGTANTGMSTDEIMAMTRGED